MAAPLSPRSANLPLKPESKGRKDQLEVKAAALRTVQREKDHPPPPPSIVKEPVNVNGEPGEVYRVGRYLGRGGFAICYEGETKTDERNLPPRKYALKIVKSAMPNVKLVEKVRRSKPIPRCFLTQTSSSKQSCKSTPRCITLTSSSSIEPSLSASLLSWSWSSATMVL